LRIFPLETKKLFKRVVYKWERDKIVGFFIHNNTPQSLTAAKRNKEWRSEGKDTGVNMKGVSPEILKELRGKFCRRRQQWILGVNTASFVGRLPWETKKQR
jgi:hypothetical protein